MKLLLFPLLLLSFPAFAQLDTGSGALGACTQGTAGFTNGGTFECASLTLSGSIAFSNTAAPLIIKVTGPVNVTGVFNMNGGNGTNLNIGTFAQVFGGEGGPGAGDGGGEDGFSVLYPGLDTNSVGGTFDTSAGRGEAANGGNLGCGDGGGGAGFKATGVIGSSCGGNGPGAAGGTVTAASIFSGTFRGGVGGGAGGDAPAGSFGAGGGGGGAIHIIAGGDITVSGSITANGGNGGAGGPDGGGGGAGSGGVIWLQSLGNIDISGAISVLGGTGGTITAGGAGGNGGVGFIRLDDADGTITGGGSFPGADTNSVSSPIRISESLKSDISCGTVKPNEKNNSVLFQVIAGFLLVNLVSFMNHRLRRKV